MEKTKKMEVAENLSNLSNMAEVSYSCGVLGHDEYVGLKTKIKEAQLDNLFAAMAAFCMK